MTSSVQATTLQAPTVREVAFDLLRQLGMTTIFGNPGSTELAMFRRAPSDFEYVLGLQEATVVGMADGHAQASSRASFVNLHSAAGVGNAMGAIFTAFKNRTPMVITAGQQARSILPFAPFLGSNRATELPQPYVKWSVEPARAADVPLAILQGYQRAMMHPRGPVLISIPADDWDHQAEPVHVREIVKQPVPDREALDRVAQQLEASEHPAFVVGSAADRASTWDELLELAERFGARVYGAPLAGRCGFPEDHELFGHNLPGSRRAIVKALEPHDFVLAIGAAAFTYHVEDSGPHLPAGTVLCQLTDDDETAVASPVGYTVVGGLKAGLQHLLKATRERPRRPWKRIRREAEAPYSTPMSATQVMQAIAVVRRPEDVVVEEAPTARPLLAANLPTTKSGTYFAMDSGGLGFGMPAAVGIALARPGTRVFGLIGDGSSMYSIQALWSAVQQKLPLTFVILNNGRYAALQDFAPAFDYQPGEPVLGTDLPGLDFVGIAGGMGCKAVRVTRQDELRQALESALSSSAPMLIDVAIK